ncbi:unnamed protein product [Mucor circinelloides]|uniref:CoA-binding domain-containing protein n=1 Tax=Mucor circinelloides f. circinelloides (strain 1006PhL) TaxID=1220926 RepID=S2JPD8_MUCC1|nr:hypothetical protein HMPREF1544_01312 [Mucor circinelloides 1006PhL]KAG1116844.1 hypothetical protein G6F42_013589 [Rhizopus arrhizus]
MTSNLSKQFFKSPYYAVVGASTARTKFGNRVLRWYQSNGLDVTPIHPKEAKIEELPTKSSIDQLPFPIKTSISIITPPSVTLGVLEQAKKLGMKEIWIQPGAEDQKVIDFAKENEANMNIILGGPCILVKGSALLQESRL